MRSSSHLGLKFRMTLTPSTANPFATVKSIYQQSIKKYLLSILALLFKTVMKTPWLHEIRAPEENLQVNRGRCARSLHSALPLRLAQGYLSPKTFHSSCCHKALPPVNPCLKLRPKCPSLCPPKTALTSWHWQKQLDQILTPSQNNTL